VAIVPKGLRSFDASDSGFFLELLPGARDRTGLPDSLRFWKGRIEQTDGARPLQVGLLTGPSGCGKSSLVKAGLLPRLAPEILPLYLEATTDDTERRIVALLHRHLPKLERLDNLAECLTAVRRGQAGLGRRKLLLVIDQFEQWLHAHQEEEEPLLIQALRQCDGERLQCLVLMRDDFALAVYRFLKRLEIPLIQGENNTVVDLFDRDHARTVLTAFGRAFGKLPPEPTELSSPQQQFVDQAVDSLSEQHRVVPVRLALFAEMFKHRPWTPEALVQVGGAEGVGRAFLEATFRSDTAPPQYRMHAKGAQRVLSALLPEVGSDIKGHRRSRDELIAAAGYAQRPAEAAELLRILDGELRLISPVESAADEFDAPEDHGESNPIGPSARSTDYHLTHDYLVPSLRRWVEDILGSTPAGRAKLLLRERSRLWNDRPLNRNLPSVAEHLRIRRWVPVSERSGPEQALLAQSAKVHVRWGVISLAGMLLLVVGAGWMWQERRQREAVAQVQVLEAAVPTDWNRTFDTLRRDGLTKLAERPLRERLAEAEAAGDTLTAVKMRTGLLATQGDPTQAEPLGQALLTLPAAEFGVVRELLATAPSTDVVAALWDQAADQPNRSAQQRFQALAGLARLAPDDPRWSDLTAFIVRHLVSLPADELVAWRPLFEPIGDAMAQGIASILGDSSLDTAVGRAAAETLSFYSTDSGSSVADSLLQSEPQRFEVLLGGVVAKNSAQVAQQFESVLAEPVPSTAPEQDWEALHIRKSRAAAGLVRMGQPAKVWPLLVFDPQSDSPQTQDPSLRTEVLHALAEYRVPVQPVVDRLALGLHGTRNEPRDSRETSIQRALLLALGGYTVGMSEEARQAIIQRLQLHTVFETNPDPGIHSACELLLRRWGDEAWLKTAQTKLKQQAQRPPAPKKNEPRRWFVDKQGQTFVVFPPGVFTMGSPRNERGRFDDDDNERQHRRRIERSFAIATTEVTRAQYAVFAKAEGPEPGPIPESRTADDPQTVVDWDDAVRYCNWLSQQEGLSPCYEIRVSEKDVTVTMQPDFLNLDGYRLPTEAEWEYACRAGVGVAWGHGRAERRLGQYAWFMKTSDNQLWPVGRLLPNEAGLFDMSGHAEEWCQDRFLQYPAKAGEHDTLLDDATTVDADRRPVSRGGSFLSTSTYVRVAYRSKLPPGVWSYYVGFRPSRTYP
jgi:formylglycine-generating enzyme required for sulfatase activity